MVTQKLLYTIVDIQKLFPGVVLIINVNIGGISYYISPKQ
jgi:hypothetical protein